MNEAPAGEVMLSLSEAAIYMGLPPLRFMALVDQGRLPPSYWLIRDGRGRRLWRASDLDRYLKRAAGDHRYRLE